MDEKISKEIYHENLISSHPLDDRRMEEIKKKIGGDLLYQPAGDEILEWFAKLEKQISKFETGRGWKQDWPRAECGYPKGWPRRRSQGRGASQPRTSDCQSG